MKSRELSTVKSGVHIKEVFIRRDLTVKVKHFRL